MGWLWLAVIGFGALALLWWRAESRSMAVMSAAALLFGAAGYAAQQNAALPGHPVRAESQGIDIPPGLVAFRTAVMPGRPGDQAVLMQADAAMRAGQSAEAVRIMLRAVDARPDDATLWTALGTAVSVHDGGQVSPTAQFAFRRAVQLAPREPGPPLFLGLAFLQAGEAEPAKAALLRALALAPNSAPYRVDIAEMLVMIDQFQAMKSGMPPAQTGR